MLKNMIVDIGGVILDDSNEVLEKFLNKSEKEIKNLSKMVYGNPNWKKCLLGEISQEEHLQKLIEQFHAYQQNFEKMLMPEYQEFVLPVMKENLEVLYELKSKKYAIYFLSNLTETTYHYIKHTLDDFDGGIYSWQEHFIKPQQEIYELILGRFHLKKEESIFFDDKLKNVQMGNQLGIRSVQFRGRKDILQNIK